MKLRNLIILGVCSVVLFAVFLLPASLVWKSVSGSMAGLPVNVEQVGGTLWDGYAEGVVRTPSFRGPVVIKWDLKALRLILGELRLGLRIEGQAFQLQGDAFQGLWGKGFTELNGDVQAILLQDIMQDNGISVEGTLKVDQVGVKFSSDRVSSAAGTISWAGGEVTAPGRGPSNPIMFPPVSGQLSEQDGNLILAVKETKNNQPLGELGLMPEKGLASVKILQRVLTLAGMENQGSDDKVLVNMQQPLPF